MCCALASSCQRGAHCSAVCRASVGSCRRYCARGRTRVVVSVMALSSRKVVKPEPLSGKRAQPPWGHTVASHPETILHPPPADCEGILEHLVALDEEPVPEGGKKGRRPAFNRPAAVRG